MTGNHALPRYKISQKCFLKSPGHCIVRTKEKMLPLAMNSCLASATINEEKSLWRVNSSSIKPFNENIFPAQAC